MTFGGDCGDSEVAILSFGDDYGWPEVANFGSGYEWSEVVILTFAGDYMVTTVGSEVAV